MTTMEYSCPHCGRVNTLHEDRGGNTPEPGNISICWVCKGMGVFTETGIRIPTVEEWSELEADPEVRAVRAAMAESYTPDQVADLLRGGGH